METIKIEIIQNFQQILQGLQKTLKVQKHGIGMVNFTVNMGQQLKGLMVQNYGV
jgi:hypothetical protein